MSTPRRIIKIRMTQRVAEDSKDILQNVADVFHSEDLEINIDESSCEKVELPMVEEAVKNAKDTLDLQDQAVKQGITKIDSPEQAESKTRRWLKILGGEGIRITAQVILKEIITNLKEKIF